MFLVMFMTFGSKLIILAIVGMTIFNCTLTDEGESSSISAVNNTNESFPVKGLDCSRFLSQVVKYDITHLELEMLYNVQKADCLDINAKASTYSTKHCKMNIDQRESLIGMIFLCDGLPTDNMKKVLANGVFNYPGSENSHFPPIQEYFKKHSVLNRPPRPSGAGMTLFANGNLAFIVSIASICLLL